MYRLAQLFRSSITRAIPACALLLLAMPAANAQRLMVRLLNAETGGPLGHENVTVVWDVDSEETTVAIGSDGLGMVQVPAGAQSFALAVGPPSGSEPFRVPYLNCNAKIQSSFSVEQAGKGGFVPMNACSDKVTLATTGEIVFWARPVPSYKADLPKVSRTLLSRIERSSDDKSQSEKP